MKKTFVILGGSIVKDSCGWRTTRFDEGDACGALGDFARVRAGAILYAREKLVGRVVRVIVCGGRGQLASVPGAPTVASVMKHELMILAVSGADVSAEEKSGNTGEQLHALQTMFQHTVWEELHIISNEYHLPRIHAFIQFAPNLATLRKYLTDGNLFFVSAEKTLVAHDSMAWSEVIASAYASPAMCARMAIEKKGVEAIKNGTYNATL